MEPVDITIDTCDDGAGEPLPPLLLRPPAERDLATVKAMYNDPATARWSLTPEPFTDAHAASFLRIAQRDWDRDSPRWVITDTDGEQVLGMVALRRQPRGVWNVTYHTAPWARRRKVALRGIHAAAEFGFAKLGVRRLEWNAIVGNHLSRLIAIRLGFQLEGVERSSADQRGTRVDQWVAALLPGELRALDDPPTDYETDRRRALHFAQPQPSLDTALPDLRLRPLRQDDIELIIETAHDPQTVRWTTIPRPYERKHAEFFVESIGAEKWRRGEQATFALADAQDKYCGAIDLRLSFPDKLLGEVGFMTSPWARGRGYMTAALKAVCDYGFEAFGLRRVEWKAHVGNEASRRAAEKAEFTMEGTLRSDVVARGEHVDSWLAAKVRQDR